jgi:hypothetical protein
VCKPLETGAYATSRSWLRPKDQLLLRQPDTAANVAGADIVETILESQQPVEMTLAALMKPLRRPWQEQVRASTRECHQ